MPYPLNNVTVNNDSYDEARTMRVQVPATSLFVAVLNRAAWMEVGQVMPGMRAQDPLFLREEFLMPGAYTLNRGYLIGALRFRRVAAPASGELEVQVSAR